MQRSRRAVDCNQHPAGALTPQSSADEHRTQLVFDHTTRHRAKSHRRSAPIPVRSEFDGDLLDAHGRTTLDPVDLDEDWETYWDEDKERSEAGLLEKELVREVEAVMEQARELLRAGPLSLNTRLDEGNPANEILSEAERGQYDLIVVGATGARDLKHRMLGSVSSKITSDAPGSVIIVREPD